MNKYLSSLSNCYTHDVITLFVVDRVVLHLVVHLDIGTDVHDQSQGIGTSQG